MNKSIFKSKKAILLIVAISNLNIIFFASVIFKIPIELSTQMITAILFLVGIGVGVQGGIDMIQSNKMDFRKIDESVNVNENVNVKQHNIVEVKERLESRQKDSDYRL